MKLLRCLLRMLMYTLSLVFCIICRENMAIASFKTALKLKPNDYSLWNKLGATQASVQSADAIINRH
ncbi:hypothetical protein V6Z12_D02G280600 [Gossypium hirsutum]